MIGVAVLAMVSGCLVLTAYLAVDI